MSHLGEISEVRKVIREVEELLVRLAWACPVILEGEVRFVLEDKVILNLRRDLHL